MMKIFFFILFYTGSIAFSQQKDTLMWFVGKWKDNKTFVIDSNLSGGSGKGTVTVQPNGTTKVNTKGNEDWNKKWDEGIKEIEKAEEEIKNTFRNGEGLIQYNLGRETIRLIENLKHQAEDYKTNPVEAEKKEELDRANASFESSLNSWCTVTGKPDYNLVMDFYRAHKNIRHEHFDLPVPPSANYDCWSCDKERVKAYEKKCDEYVEQFIAEDANLIKKALSIIRNLELIGMGENPGISSAGVSEIVEKAFRHRKGDPSQDGPCYSLDVSNMWEAVRFIISRAHEKAEQLIKDYSKDLSVIIPVNKTFLTVERSAQLLGIGSPYPLSELSYPLIKLYDSLSKKLLKEKDFSQLANIPFLLSLKRQIALLGGNPGNEDINQLLNFCHFKMNVDMDVKVGKDGGFILTHLKGSGKLVFELDSVKCIKFMLDRSEQAKLKLDVITNEIVSPAPHPVYIGTRTAESQLPQLNIHFCNPGIDSIFIARFVPANNDKGLWSVPGAPPIPAWIYGNDGIFLDPRKHASDAADAARDYQNNPQKIEQMKIDDAEMQKKMAQMQQSGKTPQQMAEEIKKMMDQGEKRMEQPASRLTQLKFPVKFLKGGKMMINERIDAKSVFPEASDAIVYGYLTIQVEHDPKK